jgi:hypothetical protein
MLKKMPNLAEYDKDGVRVFNATYHLFDSARKNTTALISKQDNDPKKDPFTNLTVLIDRFFELKCEQNYLPGENKKAKLLLRKMLQHGYVKSS